MKRALFGIFALAAFSAAADGSVSAYLASPAEFLAQSGETNAIAQLSIKGQSPSISVTSGGQIAVGRFDTLDAYGSAFTDSPVSVSVSGGGFAVAAPLEKQENAAVESALAKAAMHLDASDGDSFVFDGDGKIERWKDVRTEGGIDAVAGTVDGTYVFSRPTLAEDAINGMDAVDFGLRSGDGFSSDDAAFMSFEGGFFSNGFMVMREKTAGSGAFYLGGVGDWWYYQFHRGGLPLIGWDDAQTANAINAMWRVDGRQVGPLEYYIDGDFHVVSFAGAGSFANTLCNDRGSRAGGWQFAEVILFTEALNEDEHRAIESMLMAKWLDAPHPAETAKTAKIDTLSFGSGVDAIVDADAGMSVTSLSGEGVLVKRGGGAVSVSSLSGISSVSVEEGELSLASSFSGLLDSAFFHVDASAADTVVTDGDGHVLRVDDAGGNGRYAYVSPNVNWGAYPSVATVTNDMPAIGFGEFADWGGGTSSSMIWSETATEVKTIFAAQYRPAWSGQFLVGFSGGYPFHCSSTMLEPAYCSTAASSASWDINGEPVDPTKVGFPDEFAVYTVTNIGAGVSIDQFAQDRQMRYGGIYIGEFIAFQRNLTAAETGKIRQYLMNKWLGSVDAPDLADIYDGVSVAAGAQVDFGGDVEIDGTLSVELPVSAVPVSSAGALAFGANASLEIDVSSATPVQPGRYEIVSADSISGFDGVTVAGDAFERNSVHVSVDGGVLSVSIRPKSLTIIVR